MKKKLFPLGVLLLMVLTLLLFTACDQTEDEPADLLVDGDGEEIELAGDSAETLTLSVGRLGNDIKVTAIIVADYLGYYEKENLNVEFETISNLSDGITAVDLGKLDVLPFGVIPSATFVSQGADVVVFGGTISEGSEIITLPENADRYQAAADFRGTKIGCFRMETGHMVMKGYLREAGLNLESDVEFVMLDSQQTIMEAVRKGEVDLGFLNSGQGYIAKEAGLEVAALVSDFSADFPCCRQTTSRRTLTSNREALVRFQTANLKAYQVIMTDPDTTKEALMAHSGQPEEYVEAVIYGLAGEYRNAMIVSLDPNKTKVTQFYEIMKQNGDIDADTEYEVADHIDSTVYEDALNRLLDREPENEIYRGLLAEFKVNNL